MRIILLILMGFIIYYIVILNPCTLLCIYTSLIMYLYYAAILIVCNSLMIMQSSFQQTVMNHLVSIQVLFTCTVYESCEKTCFLD